MGDMFGGLTARLGKREIHTDRVDGDICGKVGAEILPTARFKMADRSVERVDNVEQPDTSSAVIERHHSHRLRAGIEMLQLESGGGIAGVELRPDHSQLVAKLKCLAGSLDVLHVTASRMVRIINGSRLIASSHRPRDWITMQRVAARTKSSSFPG